MLRRLGTTQKETELLKKKKNPFHWQVRLLKKLEYRDVCLAERKMDDSSGIRCLKLTSAQKRILSVWEGVESNSGNALS